MIEKDIRRLINLVEEKSEDQSPKQLNESTGVTDFNPKSQGGTRKELLAKYHKTNDPKDAEAARKAGATQKELKQSVEEGENIGGKRYDKIADLKGRTVDQLNKLIQKFEGIVAKYPDHTQASEYLGLAKMIRAEKIGKKGVAEGLVKDIKRLATGKDVKSRAGQEIAKSQDASMKGDHKTSKKHFDRYDKLDKLANKEQGLAEGMDPDKRSRLDDLIDQYKDSVDPEYDSYGSDDHYDSDDIIAQIRSEFGDNIADQVEAGAEKMHFGRPGHKHGYDPLGWRKPIDRQTKAGKMFKQDSDYRKNMVKSRYKLSGKSATEESITMESKSLIAQGINKILKR